MKCRDEFRRKQIPTFPCDNCGKLITKQKKGDHLFCNLSCRDEFNLKKYSRLYSSFVEFKNEAAYLLGLIMGDGHLKKSGNNTTRISIAFNVADFKAIEIAEDVFEKLGLNYFTEAKTPHNCKTIGFVIPDDLLKNLGILFHGNKFKNQPYCKEEEVQKLHFAVGLLNSDGCFHQSPRKKYFSFCNTVESIVKNFKECLMANGIQFKEYFHIYKEHPTWKPSIRIHIGKQSDHEKILSNEYCKWS